MKTNRRPEPKLPYRLINHTADLALNVWGSSLEELFANAAIGMFAQMADLSKLPAEVQRAVSVTGVDNEALLVAWLSELLYLRETLGEAYAHFDVRFPAPDRLEATADGAGWSAFDRPIKAVTFYGLRIERTAGEWRTTIVFDV